MIDQEIVMQGVRRLINVPSINNVVSEIIAGKPTQEKYNSLGSHKVKFIVINCLPVSMGNKRRL